MGRHRADITFDAIAVGLRAADTYCEYATSIGFTDEFLAAYSTWLKISIDKVWTTPTGG